MAKYIGFGETVEGAATDLCSRKWVQKGPKKHPVTNKTMFLYVGDRNTSVEVTKAIGEPEDEELKAKTAHFHRNVGDTLHADSISVFIDSRRGINFITKEGVSGRHGANLASTNTQTIATIKTPLAIFMKALSYTPIKQLDEHKGENPDKK